MTLDLAQFDIEKVSFEVRYENAYLLWDRAGLIWSQARTKWPAIIMKHAEPNDTTFSLDNRYELVVRLDSAFVVAHRPASNLDDIINTP